MSAEGKSTQIFASHSLTLLPILKDLWSKRLFLMYSNHCKKRQEKRKMKEFSHRFYERKLNWKFSIIYIWEKAPHRSSSHLLFFLFASATMETLPLSEGNEALRSAAGWMKWQSCAGINSLDRKKSIISYKKILRWNKARMLWLRVYLPESL